MPLDRASKPLRKLFLDLIKESGVFWPCIRCLMSLICLKNYMLVTILIVVLVDIVASTNIFSNGVLLWNLVILRHVVFKAACLLRMGWRRLHRRSVYTYALLLRAIVDKLIAWGCAPQADPISCFRIRPLQLLIFCSSFCSDFYMFKLFVLSYTKICRCMTVC